MYFTNNDLIVSPYETCGGKSKTIAQSCDMKIIEGTYANSFRICKERLKKI